jgi:hypothetical protein
VYSASLKKVLAVLSISLQIYITSKKYVIACMLKFYVEIELVGNG